jgi:hypothetical protein
MDGYYHQQQAVLRNNTSGLSTLRQLLRITWAWRGRAKRPFRRSAHLMLWALFHFVLFGLAGVFSSSFVTAGKVALSRSPYCGVFSPSYLQSLGNAGSIVNQRNLDLQAKSQDDTQLSQEYVQTCYNATNPSSSCSSYPKRQLSWSTTRNVACPFDSAVCHPSASAVSFDTGYIDSSDDLGLNAQARDRISYRRLTTCVPLNDETYITGPRNVSGDGGPTIEAVDAYYGPSNGADRNATYSYGIFTQYLAADQIDDSNPYQLHQENAYSGSGWEYEGTFLPIPELARPNADVILAFLSFDKTYENPINDIWFAAHQEAYLLQPGTNVNDTVYTRDLPVTTLGCTEQHQICTGGASNSTARKCTPLMGLYQIQTDAGGVPSLSFTDRQNSTYMRVFQSAGDSILSVVLSRLIQRDMPLLARKQVILVVSSFLPDNQWEKEAEYFFSIGMAHLQRDVVNYGTGQVSPDISFIAVANTTADKWLCQNLIVRGTPFQSFSLLALTLVFIIGLLMVLFSLVVDDIFAFVQRRWNRGAIGRKMWNANDTLQIQRMLYEHQGCGTWHDEPNGVPVTNFGDEMEMLEVGGDIALQNGRSASQLFVERGQSPERRPKTQSPSWVQRFWPHLRGAKHHLRTGHSPSDNRDNLQDLTWKNEI